MRESAKQAIDRLADERGDTRPSTPKLACINGLGGRYVVCPLTDLAIDEGDADEPDVVDVTSQAWLASDAVVDVEEVR